MFFLFQVSLIKPKKTFSKNLFKDNNNNYTSPNKYESIVIDDSDDDKYDIIRDIRNKKNKDYNKRDNSGGNSKYNEFVHKLKKRVIILEDSIVKN